MIKSYKFIVSGKVQGVYYRKTICKNANQAQINGYVKNLPDGTVEASATFKNEKDLQQFREILQQGSVSSKVDAIEEFESTDNYSNGIEKKY